MSTGVWPAVTKQHPCPVCGVGDWCCVGERAIKCMRIESDRPCKSGGWYHAIGDRVKLRPPLPIKRSAPSVDINVPQLLETWETDAQMVIVLAQSLGVNASSLIALGALWAAQHDAWAFPMRDAAGLPIGIRLRNHSGAKWSVTGSRVGLFYDLWDTKDTEHAWKGQTAFIVEGPTDTAACLTLGLKVIGKPSCNAGNELVATLLKRLRPRDVVILGDRDEKVNKITGRPTNIGLVEARKLKEQLNFKTLICPPPMGFKDIREFVCNGGTRLIIESLIKQYTWL